MLIKNYGILTPEAQGNTWAAIVIILTFTSGSALIMWLGEQITEKVERPSFFVVKQQKL